MNDWKKREINGPSAEHLAYTKQMAEIKKIPPLPKRGQCESTKRLLAMSDEEHAKHMARPFPPDGWKAAEDVETAMMKTVMRVGLSNIAHVESLRRSVKNTEGQSVLSSASDERKELARQAFTCTPPAPITEVEEERLTRLEPITMLKVMPSKSKSFWEKLKAKFHKSNEEERKRLTDEFLQEWGFKEKKDGES